MENVYEEKDHFHLGSSDTSHSRWNLWCEKVD